MLGKSFQHPRCGFDVWGSSVPEWSPKLRILRSSFFLSNRLAGCLKWDEYPKLFIFEEFGHLMWIFVIWISSNSCIWWIRSAFLLNNKLMAFTPTTLYHYQNHLKPLILWQWEENLWQGWILKKGRLYIPEQVPPQPRLCQLSKRHRKVFELLSSLGITASICTEVNASQRSRDLHITFIKRCVNEPYRSLLQCPA